VRRRAFIGTAAASAAAAGFPNIALGKGEPIRLGCIPPLTGGNALNGEEGHDGAEFAVRTINARPGKVYDDRPFELVVEDATSDNQTAVAAMNKLLTENVDAICLPVLSTQIQAMVPLVKPTGIPWLTGGTNVKNTLLGCTSLFRFRASDAITAAGLVNFAVGELKKSKIAILTSSEVFGTGGGDQCEIALKKLNLQTVSRQAWPIGTKDFTPEMLKIKEAGADAIIVYAQNPSDCALIYAALHQNALGIPIVGSPSLADANAIATAGANANGNYGALDWIPSTKSVAFAAEFAKVYNRQPAIGSGEGWVYSAVLCLADTYRKIGTTDKAKTVAALHAITDYAAMMGTYDCDADGNMLHEIGIAQIVNGAPKLVKVVKG
jgi:branched-chain amino acid transport system substrate-binding protein